jgi:hypothetical protein
VEYEEKYDYWDRDTEQPKQNAFAHYRLLTSTRMSRYFLPVISRMASLAWPTAL